MEADKHIRRDSDDGELEEPVERHVEGIAHIADTRREDFSAVKELDGAQANGPSDGIDKYAGYGSLRSPFVGMVMTDPDAHIDSHCATVSNWLCEAEKTVQEMVARWPGGEGVG